MCETLEPKKGSLVPDTWSERASHFGSSRFCSLVCVCVCVCVFFVSRSRCGEFFCVLLFVVLTAAVSSNFLQSPMTVRKEMDGKRRRRGDGWQGKTGWKSFLPKLLLLMDGRSGTIVSVVRRTCGQGRDVEGARQTFRLYCTVNTRRLFRPRRVGVVRTRLHSASVKTKCWRTKPIGQKIQNYGSCVKKTAQERRKEIVGAV